MKLILSFALFCIAFCLNSNAQADFYSLQALGDRYIYNSKYFNEPREIQVYRSGVNATLESDSLLTIYVFENILLKHQSVYHSHPNTKK